MEGKSEESVVREYKRLQMHLNPRNSVISKTRGKSICKWGKCRGQAGVPSFMRKSSSEDLCFVCSCDSVAAEL